MNHWYIRTYYHKNLWSFRSTWMCNFRLSQHYWSRLISSHVVPCSLVLCYRLGEACCLYFQGDQRHAWLQMMEVSRSSKTLVKKITNQWDIISQKTVFNIWKCLLFFLIALFGKNNLSKGFRDHALNHEFNGEKTQPEHHCQSSVTASVGRYQHPPELLYGGTQRYSWSRQHATSQRLRVQFPGLTLLAAPWPWGLFSL